MLTEQLTYNHIHVSSCTQPQTNPQARHTHTHTHPLSYTLACTHILHAQKPSPPTLTPTHSLTLTRSDDAPPSRARTPLPHAFSRALTHSVKLTLSHHALTHSYSQSLPPSALTHMHALVLTRIPPPSKHTLSLIHFCTVSNPLIKSPAPSTLTSSLCLTHSLSCIHSHTPPFHTHSSSHARTTPHILPSRAHYNHQYHSQNTLTLILTLRMSLTKVIPLYNLHRVRLRVFTRERAR